MFLLYDIRIKDKLLNYFINSFDANYYSFHNCNKETIDYFKKINNNQNTNYLEYNNISYTNTIYNTIQKLKSIGCIQRKRYP